MRVLLSEALRTAMKARDRSATSAIRSALAAIDNAEAVDVSVAPREQPGVIAGGVAGLGAGEVARRTLTDDEARAIVRAAISERETAAAEYDAHRRFDEASRLRAEAAALVEVLARSG